MVNVNGNSNVIEMKTFQFDVSTFHQWNYIISKRERIRWKIEPTIFSIVTDLSRSDRKKECSRDPFRPLFIQDKRSRFPDQRKKRNLKKTNPWIEERGDDLPRITTLLLCQDLSPPRIILSQQVHPWCRALFPSSPSSSSSFLPFTRRHLPTISPREETVVPPSPPLRRFNRSTEAIRV